MIDASGHDAWIRMRNWQDGKSTENYRLTSMIGEPADFHAFVREDLPCGWKNRRPVGRRFSWTVCRQFTDREPQGPRGEHWSHTLASGEEVDTFAEAKSQDAGDREPLPRQAHRRGRGCRLRGRPDR
jgi:hypothetical protein